MLERSERRAWWVAIAGFVLGLLGIAAVFVQGPLRRVVEIPHRRRISSHLAGGGGRDIGGDQGGQGGDRAADDEDPEQIEGTGAARTIAWTRHDRGQRRPPPRGLPPLSHFSRRATSGTLEVGLATSSTFLRDAWLIAGFDLRESIRTRRALVLALLYLLVASITSYIYVEVVKLAQEAASEVIGGMGDANEQLAATAAAGAAQDAGYTGLLYVIAGGDNVIAGHLATYPAMVLVFAWFSLGALPWLISLTSYDLVAGDLHQRTVRFVALRTSRGAFVLGKLLSQVLLVAMIAGLGMIPVLVIGGAFLPRFDFTSPRSRR